MPAEVRYPGAGRDEYVRPLCLSVRQRQVLEAAAAGLTEIQTARTLDVAPATVEYHMARARAKLCARSTAQAVALAIVHGLIVVVEQPEGRRA